MVLDKLKELLTPSYFSVFGYTVAVLYLFTGVTLLGITATFETRESRNFVCDVRDTLSDKNFVRGQCYEQYKQQYNSPFPLYGFVLLSFGTVTGVCVAYSWCFAKSRVDEIENAFKPDPENPHRRLRVETRRVFHSYFLHLLVRLVLGILFTVLQNFIFYPFGFPTEFPCVLPTVTATVQMVTNSAVYLNVTSEAPSSLSFQESVSCHNSVGFEISSSATATWIVNTLAALLVFGETCYLVVRALQRKELTFDSEFCRKYLYNKTLSTCEAKLRQCRTLMKTRILQDTENIEPLIAADIKDRRAVDDVFVDLVIHGGRAKYDALDDHDSGLIETFRHKIYRRNVDEFNFLLSGRKGKTSVAIQNLEELFLPNEEDALENAQDPRKILIIGRPGMGKSLLCTKLSRDWTKSNRDDELLNSKFTYFFLFQFRQFNSTDTMAVFILETRYPSGRASAKIL